MAGCKKEKAYKPNCPPDEHSGLSAKEICCKYAGAVVGITSQAFLTDIEQASFDFATSNLTSLEFKANGAFIQLKGCLYILCSSASILIPPTLLANNLRYPFVNADATITGQVPDEVVRFSKILVTVRNLNGRPEPAKCSSDGQTVVYEAQVCFVDGAGGYGLLQINDCTDWNRCMPDIPNCKRQPHFCFGNSRALSCGQPIFLMGNVGAASHTNITNVSGGSCPYTDLSSFGITEGVVINHRGADASGWIFPELLVADTAGFSPSLGMPMIDRFGRLVGLQLTGTPGVVEPGICDQVGNGIVAGITESFMKGPLRCFYKSCDRGCKSCYREHISNVADVTGSFCKYVKGYVGMAYTVTDAKDFNTIVEDTATGVRTPLFLSDGNLYPGPACKNLYGVTIITLAGELVLTYAFVPGPTALAPYNTTDLNDSTLLGVVPPGAIVLGFSQKNDCCYFGEGSNKVVPALYTWKTVPSSEGCTCCDSVNFEVRTINVNGRVVEENNCISDTECIERNTLTFPAVNDYPWGVVNNVPLVASPGGTPVGNSYLPSSTFVPSI